MKRTKLTEADWQRARVIMARSIRGYGVSPEDGTLLEHLLAADEKRYTRTHREEKDRATSELNQLSRPKPGDGEKS